MGEEPDLTASSIPMVGNRGRHRPDVPNSPAQAREQKRILHEDLELVHGPAHVEFEDDELVILVIVRDGRPYVESFVEHYFALGAKHLVFLDNGSEDGTISALKEYDSGVTVLKTGLSFKEYQISMRQYLVERFGRERWTLSVDIDEFFDYPFSSVVSLKALLRYLNRQSYTAVVAQMLDVVPDAISAKKLDPADERSLLELHRYYDTSNVTIRDYDLFKEMSGNEVSNEEIKVLQGGVQRRLFGLSPLLTKHPLVFLTEGVRPLDLSEHWVGGARVADFCGVLLHHKLSDTLYDLTKREIEKRTYPNRHGKYDKYLETLEGAQRLVLKSETSRELQSTDALLGTPFLVFSEKYLEFVGQEDLRQGGTPEAHTRRLFEAFLNAGSEVRAQASETARLRKQNNNLGRRLERRTGGQGAAKKSEGGRPRRVAALEQKARNAEHEKEQAQRQVETLTEQITAIQSSRAWRVLKVLSRVKTAAKGATTAPRRRGAGDAPGAPPETRPARRPDRKLKQAPTRPQERPRREAKPRKAAPVFFVVGSGKSGTTWIARLLDAHSEVLCKGEGRFFNREWERADLRNVDANVPPRTLYGALAGSRDLKLWMERSVWGRQGDQEELLAGTTRAVIDYFLNRKLAESSKRIVGDKTPFLPGVSVVKEINGIYPEAKVIHIIRDGRDVEVSWMYHRWNRSTDRGGAQVLTPAEEERRAAYQSNVQEGVLPEGFDEAELRRRAGLWKELVGGAMKDGPELLRGNYAEVRYEDLLEDPAKEMKRLFAFLGAESGDDTVRQCVETASFERRSGGRKPGEEDPYALLRKGVAGDWKNYFTEQDRRIFKEEAGDLLIRLGYESDDSW